MTMLVWAAAWRVWRMVVAVQAGNVIELSCSAVAKFITFSPGSSFCGGHNRKVLARRLHEIIVILTGSIGK